MTHINLSRRKLLSFAATLSAVAPLAAITGKAVLAEAQSGAGLVATPRQTEGPFYPRSKPQDIDNDLAAFEDNEQLAKGELLTLRGQVLDLEGKHINGARIEIWHCDELGKYHHVGAELPLDENFQGYGETITSGDGHYGFRTVKPGLYPGRACHIHFNVLAPGKAPLTSQMYFDDEMKGNLRDGIYRSLTVRQQAAVTMKTFNSSPGNRGRTGKLDIILA